MPVGNLNINKVNLLQHPYPPTDKQTGIDDTGATGHSLQPTAPHNQYTTGAPPIVVGIPNGKAMRSTQECQLQLEQLPAQARTGKILTGLARHSLISIGHLCDAGCTAGFMANTMNVKKYGNILLRGWRAPPGLWHLPLTNQDNTGQQTPPESHNAYKTTKKAEHMQYLHAAAFRPGQDVKNTFCMALIQVAGTGLNAAACKYCMCSAFLVVLYALWLSGGVCGPVLS